MAKSVSYKNKYGVATYQTVGGNGKVTKVTRFTPYDRKIRGSGFASRTTDNNNSNVSRYESINEAGPDIIRTNGTVRNNKSLKEAKAQLKRIEAMSDGSERHKQLVERARSTVQALSDYQALGATAG